MVRVQRTALMMLMWSTTMWVAASAAAQSQTCTDGSSLWSSITSIAAEAQANGRAELSDGDARELNAPRDMDALPVSPSVAVDEMRALPIVDGAAVRVNGDSVLDGDVQWCVDSDDPRCSPDPAGAPSGHLAHAGDAARASYALTIAAAPCAITRRRDLAHRCHALGVRSSIERPPQAR